MGCVGKFFKSQTWSQELFACSLDLHRAESGVSRNVECTQVLDPSPEEKFERKWLEAGTG